MKIVDLSTDVAGQWAAKLFAMGGASVLRPELGVPRPAALAEYLDAFKERVPWPGPSLIEDADIVFTSFDRGNLTGLAAGLRLPDTCVHVTTSTFGMMGPYADYRGGPLAAWAAGGYLSITGRPDREPLVGPEYLCEYVAGYTAAIAAEAALCKRRRTGRGEHVDVSAMEAMLPMHQTTFSNLAFGMPRRRTGRYYEIYPMAARPCRNGHVLICVVTDTEFDQLAVAIGRPDLLTDERFQDGYLRFANRDALDEAMAPYLESRDAEEIVEHLHAHGVTAAKIAEADDIRANPQLAYREFWQANSAPGNPVPTVRTFTMQTAPSWRSGIRRPPSGRLPLEGVVVADFTVFWAGPSASRLLADLGARVIWVERPGSRATWKFDPQSPAGNAALLFQTEMSRGKESLMLDLNSEEGKRVARDLVAQCDVVIENNRPGVMDKLGLGAEALCSSHPQLVYVSLPGFGSSGPWSQRRSYGPIIEASSSIVGRTGYKDDEPLRLGHPLPDPTGGLAGAIAALRGLRQCEETGVGGWFDVAQLDAYVAMCGEDLIGGGRVPRIGNESRFGAHLRVYPCAGDDEWIAVRLCDEQDRQAFAAVTGCIVGDHSAVCVFTSGRDKSKLARQLQIAGIEAFPVLKPEDLPVEPNLRARHSLIDLAFGDRIAVLAGSPLRGLTDTSRKSPDFGEHTQALLEELAAVKARKQRS